MQRKDNGIGESERLQELLLNLNLTVAHRNIQELLSHALVRQVSYSQFLIDVLSQETDGRFEKKIARNLKRSGLGTVKSLEEFDFSVRRKLSAAAVKELLNCQWVEEGRSILCIGKSGTGKSHISKSLGFAACMKGYSVIFTDAATMLEELYASLADNTYQRVFRRYAGVGVLAIEDITYIPKDPVKTDHLFRLVNARHPRLPFIVTANAGFENWGKFFLNQAQAIATVDRLIDQATILRFTGKGFRKPRDIYGDALDSDEK